MTMQIKIALIAIAIMQILTFSAIGLSMKWSRDFETETAHKLEEQLDHVQEMQENMTERFEGIDNKVDSVKTGLQLVNNNLLRVLSGENSSYLDIFPKRKHLKQSVLAKHSQQKT